MQRIIALVLLLALPYVAHAQGYAVKKISPSKNRVILEGSLGTLKFDTPLVFTDEFGEECVGRIAQTKNNEIMVDVTSCKNTDNIKEGSTFKVASGQTANRPTSPSTTQSTNGAPTIDEDWYTLWGFGLTETKYDDDEVEDILNDLEDNPSVDRGTVNGDLFGFYWPHADKKSMSGFIINSIADAFDGPNGDMSVNQVLYAYSYHQFFGANIGDGWFVRGDVGLAKYSVTVDVTGYEDTDVSDWGWGVLGGGGYAWGIGVETRLLLGGYITHRSVDGDAANSFNFNIGFLF